MGKRVSKKKEEIEEILESAVEEIAVEVKKSAKSEAVVYPVWRYHKDHEAKIVRSAEQEKALGAGWVDSPAKLK